MHKQIGIKYIQNQNSKPALTSQPNPGTKGNVYRVIVDGKQIGVYGEFSNIVNQLEKEISKAKEIKIQIV